jgi:hypothetical protein
MHSFHMIVCQLRIVLIFGVPGNIGLRFEVAHYNFNINFNIILLIYRNSPTVKIIISVIPLTAPNLSIQLIDYHKF